VAPETLFELLEFFRLFADRCHHGKEEDLLFPLLQRKGLPAAGGPVAVMLYEHEQGRALIREMTEAADVFRSDTVKAGGLWAEAARQYAALLREHIAKENNILFVMAENLLSPAEQAELAAAFEKVEEEKMGAGTHERLNALMNKLAGEVHHTT
jgi:hemerythrin-like domain-containing protein